MITFIQFLLAVVITTLTLLIAVAGVQVFQILHELRLTLKKLNRIMDNTQNLSETAAKPIIAVNEFFSEVKNLVNQTEDQITETTPDRVVPESRISRVQRFFRRSGLPLRPQ